MQHASAQAGRERILWTRSRDLARRAQDVHDVRAAGRLLWQEGLIDDVLLAGGRPWCTGLAIAREALAGVWPEGDLALSVTGLGMTPLLLAGNGTAPVEEARRAKALWAFALTEPNAGSDPAGMEAAAVRDGPGFRIDGEKRFISLAGDALFLTVFARLSAAEKPSAFLVRREQDGVRTQLRENLGDHPVYAVQLDGAHAEAMVGDAGRGLTLAYGTLALFRPSVGAQGIGIGREALRLSLARARERRQFGRPIGEFGEVQGLLVESYLRLLAARAVVRQAAQFLDQGAPAAELSSAAKLLGTEAGFQAADAAVAVFGGAGVLEGSPALRLFALSRAPRLYEGANELQRHLIARWLLRQDDPFEEGRHD